MYHRWVQVAMEPEKWSCSCVKLRGVDGSAAAHKKKKENVKENASAGKNAHIAANDATPYYGRASVMAWEAYTHPWDPGTPAAAGRLRPAWQQLATRCLLRRGREHGATPARKMLHPCAEKGCNYTTNKRSHLARHARTHTGERPFACEAEGCGYSATTRQHLATHARTHAGERPFYCEEEGCGYSAAQRGNLTAHARTHTGERDFACEVEGCGYSATARSSLARHARSQHARA